MSNYAPDPAKEEIYNNLQNKTLSSVSAEDIQSLTDPTFLQSTNQDALITYNTVNKAAMRDGRAMPGTMVITTNTVAYNDNDNATEYEIVLTPQKGEVWQLLGAQSQASGGSVGASLYWGTGIVSATEPITPYVLIAQESSTGGPVFNPLAYGGDLFFDENLLCFMNGYSMAAGESVELKCAFIRVR